MKNKFLNLYYFIGLIIFFQILGCVATPNYYTGKTLSNGEKILTAGIDNVYVAHSKNLKQKINRSPFTVSFGYSQGLPSRFEMGLRYIPVNVAEGLVRWETTPDSFDFFDLSINSHLIFFIPYVGYSKYGFTLSKEIRTVEPFINYYQYFHLFGMEKGNSNINESFTNYRTVGAGLAFPIPGAQIIPEINYQYSKSDISNGVFFFNIGFRSKLK